MASGPITSWQIDGETVTDFIFLGSKVTADGDCSHKIKWCLLLRRKAMTNLDSILKSRGITLPTKARLWGFDKVKAMVFPVVMYGCENWTIKKAERQRIGALCPFLDRARLQISLGKLIQPAEPGPGTTRLSTRVPRGSCGPSHTWPLGTVVLEKTLESPLDCKEIQPVHPEGDQSWVFIGRTDAKAETPVLWPLDAKNWLIRKDPDAGEDGRQEEKGRTEDEMVGWHHWLDGHEFEQALGVGDGQGGLVCCSPWGHKESDTTEWLNWTEAWKSKR